MKKQTTIAEIEKEIVMREELLKILEDIKSSGLILKRSGKGFLVSKDYNKIKNGGLSRLTR